MTAKSKRAAVSLAASLGSNQGSSFLATKSPDDLITRQVKVERIEPRPGGNIRRYNPAFVVEIADSIATIGLLEPLVVDTKNRILAGDTRRCSCLLLRTLQEVAALPLEERRQRIAARLVELSGSQESLSIPARVIDTALAIDIDRFAKDYPGGAVPVRIMPLDAERQPEEALCVEVTENEHRHDFTRSEVIRMVERYEERGYTRRVGKPRAGEKPLLPALAKSIGKSQRQVARLLTESAVPPNRAQPAGPPAVAMRILKDLPTLEASYADNHSAQAKVLIQAAHALTEALTAILKTSKAT